jgi:acetyl-CoA decarbonylase/synthase complex subunit delta
MEAVGAVTYLMAGSDILIMRHPESIRLVKAFIDLPWTAATLPMSHRLPNSWMMSPWIFAALAPEPDLTIEEEKKAAPAKKGRTAKRPHRQAGRLPNRRPSPRPKSRCQEG